MSIFDNLGDKDISNKLKAHFAVKELTPGMVIRIYDPVADKEKWLLILGIEDGNVLTGVVRINTDINFNVNHSKELQDLQYPLSKKDNGFLKWDSHVDCSNLFDRKYDELLKHVTQNPEELKGTVTNRDFDLITGAVKESPTITPKKLKQFKLN